MTLSPNISNPQLLRKSYFSRLEMDDVGSVGIDELNALIKQHVRSIPFENLNIIQQKALSLNLSDLAQKVLFQKRGGFCYELNYLFAAFLTSLGYEVSLISGRVNNGKGEFGPEHDHLCLLVKLEQNYLVDVGFGRMAERAIPVPAIGEISAIQDGEYIYRIASEGGQLAVQLFQAPHRWKDLYLFTEQNKAIEQFEEMFIYHQTHSNSPFTQKLIVSKPTASGRISISDNRLIQSHRESKAIRTLKNKSELKKALEEHFGIIDI